MNKNKLKQLRRKRRRIGIRKRVLGTADRPRLAVYRSLSHTYAQIINDLEGKTIVSASTRDKDCSGATGNTEAAQGVGARLAERAKQAGVTSVVLDRAGFRYHGRVKALAEAARKGGLSF